MWKKVICGLLMVLCLGMVVNTANATPSCTKIISVLQNNNSLLVDKETGHIFIGKRDWKVLDNMAKQTIAFCVMGKYGLQKVYFWKLSTNKSNPSPFDMLGVYDGVRLKVYR